jgi:hypothetical protein
MEPLPRVFLSATSPEFRSVRKSVAATLRTLGFAPVSQDDFPTGHGGLLDWLRSQIDDCAGLLQIAGVGLWRRAADGGCGVWPRLRHPI